MRQILAEDIGVFGAVFFPAGKVLMRVDDGQAGDIVI